MIIVFPSLLSSSNNLEISAPDVESRLPVGSSASIISGLLASALAIAPEAVLNWLNGIQQQVPEIWTAFGLGDAGRGPGETSPRTYAIDVASTIIGLTNKGPRGFENYLRINGLEDHFNDLYAAKSAEISAILDLAIDGLEGYFAGSPVNRVTPP